MSETKIAQSIIDDVSVVLANTVFHSDLQGETYDALRSKAAELLGKLDVTASELDQIEQMAERVKVDTKAFKEGMGDTPKHSALKVLQGLESVAETPKRNSPESLYTAKDVKFSDGELDHYTLFAGTTTKTANAIHDPAKKPPEDLYKQRSKRFCEVAGDILDGLNGKGKGEWKMIDADAYDRGDKASGPITKSFLSSDKFTGKIGAHDFDKVKDRLDGSDFGSSGKSYEDIRKDHLVDPEEAKKSEDTKTETSSTADKPSSGGGGGGAPAGGGGGGGRTTINTGGGGGGGGFSPMPRTGSFGSFGKSGGGGGRTSLLGKKDGDGEDGEIDIDKMISDMVEENSKNEDGEVSGVEDALSDLPEDAYTVVKDSNGDPMGYRVSKDLGSGVYLFDNETGKSTLLQGTDQDGIYYDKSSEKYYEMNFPDDDEGESSDMTLDETESDANVVDASEDNVYESDVDADTVRENVESLTSGGSDADADEGSGDEGVSGEASAASATDAESGEEAEVTGSATAASGEGVDIEQEEGSLDLHSASEGLEGLSVDQGVDEATRFSNPNDPFA